MVVNNLLRACWRAGRWIVGLLLMASLVACPQPAIETAEEPAQAASAEEPAVEPTEEPAEEPMEEPMYTISMMLPAYPGSQDVLEQVFTWFMEENPDIALEFFYMPIGDYFESLRNRAAAGDMPDVALLSYNAVAAFQEAGMLDGLNQLDFNDPDYFLPDALAMHSYNEELYGLPWLRSGCSPAYENLAVFHMTEADVISRLFTFLTQPGVQIFIFEESGWYPTVRQVYGELALECEFASVLRLSPTLVEETIALVKESVPTLIPVLGEQTLATERATAITSEEIVLSRAAPMAENVSAEEVMDRLEGDGLTVGALFILDSPELGVTGDYAVACRYEREAFCSLIGPQGEMLEVMADTFQDGLPQVLLPAVAAEEGSKRSCFYIDGLKICIRIG